MQVVLDNHILQVTLSKPGGLVLCLCYGGIENVLETRNRETNRGYAKFPMLVLSLFELVNLMAVTNCGFSLGDSASSDYYCAVISL